jgi:hypothetical protein
MGFLGAMSTPQRLCYWTLLVAGLGFETRSFGVMEPFKSCNINNLRAVT